MEIELPASGWRPRPYQKPLWRYLENGGRHAVAVWHRRAGKDEVGLHWSCWQAHRRVGNYWHMLPEYTQARKVIWDAINPHTGKRRIDEAFPEEIRKATNNQEMKIELKVGSIWQCVGSDNFNSLLGSPPVGIVYSEWSLADPLAHAYLSPILAENGGWALFIYTARGYNHGFSTYEGAKNDTKAFAQLLTADETNIIDRESLDDVLRTYRDLYGNEHGDSLFRQEFYNDWAAANIGAVLGIEIEKADRNGRIVDFDAEDWPIEISSDIGYRDTASWWFWQPKLGGFDLIDYDQGSGLDADDWIERLQKKPYRLGKIWLPHDAKIKTFQSKHSAMERFLEAFGADKIDIIPQGKIVDRINAARHIIKRCRFHRTNCKQGLNGLRSWAFEFNESTGLYGREPKHDWASHPGDAFSYGAQIMSERVVDKPEEHQSKWWHEQTLDEMWAEQPRLRQRI